MATNYPGIDYALGTANVDRATGIRYGVINLNALNEWAIEDFEADYGEPHCGHCGNPAVEYDDEKHGEYEQAAHECSDHACEDCERSFGSESAYGDEPCGWGLDDGETSATMGQGDNDIFVLKSPYYTHAQFCSPCAPGAGHLENPCPTGPRTYCFGHEWFEGERAPYPVYSVETGEVVEPK